MKSENEIESKPCNFGPWLPKPWGVALWAVLALVLGWQVYLGISASWRGPKTSPTHVTDFVAFYAAGKLAWRGDNIYDYKKSGISRRPYLYPPTLAVLVMMPLALLPYNAAVVVFSLLNSAALVGTLWLMRWVMWRGYARTGLAPPSSAWGRFLAHPNTGVLVSAVLCVRFIAANGRNLNVNMIVVFLIALALWLMVQQIRKSREFLSGVAIALATAVKVTPGLFGVYLLWSWRKFGMLGGAVGLALWLLLVPAVGLGWSSNVERLKEYTGHINSAVTGADLENDPIGHDRADQKQTEGGVSIRGTIMRMFTYKPMKYTDVEGQVRYFGVTFVKLDESEQRNLARVFEVLFVVLTALLTSRHFARTTAEGIALSFGLVAVTMLMVSPLTRSANLCALVIPCAAVLALIQQGRVVGRLRTFCLFAVSMLLLSSVITSQELIGKYRSEWVTHAGQELMLQILIYSASALVLWRLGSESKAQPG